MKLIVASHNTHKINEFKQFFKDTSVEIVGLKEIGFTQEIIEDGKSFVENAMIKAQAIHQLYPDSIVIADDSGLCIKALSDRPGIYSARYLGEETSFRLKNEGILKEMEHITQRQAYFACAMVLLYKDFHFTTQQLVYGHIADGIYGCEDFGYDPIFIPEGTEKTYGQDREMKQQISHRVKALKEVVKYVKYLGF